MRNRVPDSDLRSRVYSRYRSKGAALPQAEKLDDLTSRLPYLTQLVRRHFPEDTGARILDLGCGDGVLLHVAQTAGYANIFGVDVSAEQVERAKRLGIIGVSEGDLIETLRGTVADSLDAVVTYDVIEHFSLAELLPLVDDVRRVLKPGGRWIIHCPNGDSPFVGRVRYGDITHVQGAFTDTSLRQLLLASGFSTISCYEDRPVVHGVRSALRYALWRALRAGLLLYLFSESGTAGSRILSQNLLAIGVK